MVRKLKTLEVTVEGETFTIRRYTVAEKIALAKQTTREMLEKMDTEQQYGLTMKTVADNTGLEIVDLRNMDNVMLDKLYMEVIRFNSIPLESKGQSSSLSSETTQSS